MWGLETITNYVAIDYLIIGGVFLLLLWDAFRGLGRVSALSLALVVALILAPTLTETYFLSGVLEQFSASPWFGLGSFIVLAIVLYFGLRLITEDNGYGTGFLQALLGATGAIIVILVAWQRLESANQIWDFGTRIDTLFSTPFIFWWLIGAIALLAIARR